MGTNVVLDNEWLKEYQIETLIVNQSAIEIGLLIGSKMEGDHILVKVYQLKYDEVEKHYTLWKEADPVICEDEEEKQDYLEQVPYLIKFVDEEQVH